MNVNFYNLFGLLSPPQTSTQSLANGSGDPNWVADMPDPIIKSWFSYLFKHKFIGVVILIIIVLIIIYIIPKLEFSGVKFKIIQLNRKKKKDKKTESKSEITELNEANHKIGNLNNRIDQLEKQLIDKQRDIKRLLGVKRKLENEKNEIIDITLNLINKSEHIASNFECVKSAIFYVTSDNKHYNNLMIKLFNNEKISNNLLYDFYMDLQYNMLESLTDKGDNVRVSIMRYDRKSQYLEIICKLGKFNCNTGDFLLRKGEGLAGISLEQGIIINIPDVKSNSLESSTQLAITNKYLPAKKTDITTSSLHIPIFVMGEPEGVINVSSPRVGAFKAEDELIVRLYAEKLSRLWGIENFRKMR